jgi:hypothetical protein
MEDLNFEGPAKICIACSWVNEKVCKVCDDCGVKLPIESVTAEPTSVRVREDTCPHGCGFKDNPDAVFDHKTRCQKNKDVRLLSGFGYIAPDEGPAQMEERLRQEEAKERLSKAKNYATALSLTKQGRKSSDPFPHTGGAYMYLDGRKDRDMDERDFHEANLILQEFEKGNLCNPYVSALHAVKTTNGPDNNTELHQFLEGVRNKQMTFKRKLSAPASSPAVVAHAAPSPPATPAATAAPSPTATLETATTALFESPVTPKRNRKE